LAPRNDLEARLVEIWRKVLAVGPVGVRDNFFDLGGHSLLAVSLFAEMEEAFGRHLPLATLFQAPTVEQLAQALRSEGLAAPSWSSLVPIETRGTKPPLFCVHTNTGQVLFYRDLARNLEQDQPVYGLQSVGLNGKEEPLTRVEEMAAHYIEEIRKVQPQGPYLLGGFCMGAYIALEMAHQLQAQGLEVALLASICTDGIWKTVTSFRGGMAFHLRNLSRLGPGQRLAYLVVRLRYRFMRFRGSAAVVVCRLYLACNRHLPPALRQLHIHEVNSRASRKYSPRTYRGKLTYFQAAGDGSPDLGQFWGNTVTDGLEIHVVPGTNASVLGEPNVRVLAEKLQACLNKAVGRRHSI
jgi:thioesterase domain-containing protein/acyl carrier protein